MLQAREEASGAAEEAVRAELDEAIQALRDVTRNLEQGLVDRERLESEVLLGASEDVATLVLELSRRVVGETLALHPRALRNLVTAAMERLPGEGPVKVHVPPEDLHVLQAHLEGEQNVIWVPDAELRNGCRVETELGRVEASLDAAFSALEVAVAEWLEEQRG